MYLAAISKCNMIMSFSSMQKFLEGYKMQEMLFLVGNCHRALLQYCEMCHISIFPYFLRVDFCLPHVC